LRKQDIPGGWEVYPTYLVHQGCLIIPGGATRSREYQPLDHPELPYEIAKLWDADDETILNFAEVWGLLGFPHLFSSRHWLPRFYYALPDEVEHPGEPLDWIRRQARRFRLCIALVDALNRADEQQAADSVRTFIATDSERPGGTEWWAHREGFARYFEEDLPGDAIEQALTSMPLQVAKDELESCISTAISGISPYLEIWPQPAVRYRYTAMVELAFLNIAGLAAEQARIGRCEECGALFHMSDQRQRFCPKGPLDKQSTCANRSRWTRFKNKGGTHGQAR
jgi:hypothetical protein